MKLNKYLLFFILFINIQATIAENNVDSLLVIIGNTEGEQKIQTLLNLAQDVSERSINLSITYTKRAIEEAELKNLNSQLILSLLLMGKLMQQQAEDDSSLFYYQNASNLANKEGDLISLAKANHYIGQIYRKKSNYFLTEEYFKKALNYSKLAKDSLQIVDILTNLGYLYNMQGKTDTAIACMEKALDISNIINLKEGIARTSVAIGNIYYSMGKKENSLKYYNRTYEIAVELKNKKGIGISLTNIASVYNSLGNNKIAMEKILESIEYLQKTNAYSLLANSYSNLANIQADSGLFYKAFVNLSKSLKLFKKYGNKQDIAISMITHSYVYSIAGQYIKSNSYLDSALIIAKEIDFVLMQQKVYETFADNYKNMGDYKQSLKYNQLYFHFKDSLESEKMKKQLMDFEAKYETLQKEKKIEVLQKEKVINEILLDKKRIERNYYLGTLIFLILLIIGMYQSRKREKQMSSQKLELLKQKEHIATIKLEKNRLQKEELENKVRYQNKQLTTHALNMLQKNRLLKSVEKDLDALKKVTDTEKNHEITRLKRQVTKTLRGEKDWELFKMYFEKVNKNFYIILKNKYSNLTTSELKLCALIKLNLNIKETAAILNLSPETIKSSRYRLRKKLGLNQIDDLGEFIQGF